MMVEVRISRDQLEDDDWYDYDIGRVRPDIQNVGGAVQQEGEDVHQDDRVVMLPNNVQQQLDAIQHQWPTMTTEERKESIRATL
jgi:hypothetical protein